MFKPEHTPGPLAAADEAVICRVRLELSHARAKFPAPSYTMTALTEEIGELARAALHSCAANEPDPYASRDVLAEAIQVAAMAIRLATEGDHSIGLAAAMGADGAPVAGPNPADVPASQPQA